MRKNPGDTLNEEMILLGERLTDFRKQVKIAQSILIRLKKEYRWHKERNVFPDSPEFEEDLLGVKRPDESVMQVRRIEYWLHCCVAEMREVDPSGDELKLIPRSWEELDKLDASLQHLYKTLQNETNSARKKCVSKMIQVYAGQLAMKVDSKNKIKPIALRGAHFIIDLKYDYSKKMLMGIDRSGKKIPARLLKRK